jgi:predicted kinase
MLRLYQRRYDDPEYPALVDRCTDLIWSTAQQVLSVGIDVVLDWNLWSRHRRQVWRDKIESAGHHPVLHHLTAPIETAIERAQQRARDASPHAHVLDGAAVRHLATLFEPPAADEGIEIRLVRS